MSLGVKVGGAIRYYDWAVTSPWPFGRGLLTTPILKGCFDRSTCMKQPQFPFKIMVWYDLDFFPQKDIIKMSYF